jgi:hypothetical protein
VTYTKTAIAGNSIRGSFFAAPFLLPGEICRERDLHQSTSSGSLPVGLPLASSVIFSTRASA